MIKGTTITLIDNVTRIIFHNSPNTSPNNKNVIYPKYAIGKNILDNINIPTLGSLGISNLRNFSIVLVYLLSKQNPLHASRDPDLNIPNLENIREHNIILSISKFHKSKSLFLKKLFKSVCGKFPTKIGI